MLSYHIRTTCKAIFFLSSVYLLLQLKSSELPSNRSKTADKTIVPKTSNEVPLFLVLCRDHVKGDDNFGNVRRNWQRQKEQIITLLGSVIYLSSLDTVKVILFVDSKQTFKEIDILLTAWPTSYRQKLRLDIRLIDQELLSNESLNSWRQCAWIKYFGDKLLPDYDSVVFLDTDVLLLGPVEEIRTVFSSMDSLQAIGCGPEVWYLKVKENRTKAGDTGLNTGTLFFNLTRIRKAIPKGLGYSMLKMKHFKVPPRNSQDVFNEYLADKTHLLLEVSARFNFIVTSCLDFAPKCRECEKHGILVLHGADSTFYRELDNRIKSVYDVWKSATKLMKHSLQDILNQLEKSLRRLKQYKGPLIYMCQAYQHLDDQLLYHIRKII